LPGPDKHLRFERAILPHLDAAYNLARWLMRNEDEAADAVQDACLRALRFIGGFRGGDGRVILILRLGPLVMLRFGPPLFAALFSFPCER
jgi:hypothetical protein